MIITVTVSLRLDLEKAAKAGCSGPAERMLGDFHAQGEDWQREVTADPLVRQFLEVRVEGPENGRG